MAYSYDTTTASGSTATVAVPFAYLDQTDVHVSVGGVEVSQSLLTWATPSTIVLPSTPTAGAAVKVWRKTPIASPDTVFEAGNFSHRDLNRVVLQVLYADQEANDAASEAISIVATVPTAIAEAQASAEAATTAATSAAAAAAAAATWDPTLYAALTGATYSGDVAISKTTPSLVFNRPALSGDRNQIICNVAGQTYWNVKLPNGSGDFTVERWVGGSYVDIPFTIVNATGNVSYSTTQAGAGRGVYAQNWGTTNNTSATVQVATGTGSLWSALTAYDTGSGYGYGYLSSGSAVHEFLVNLTYASGVFKVNIGGTSRMVVDAAGTLTATKFVGDGSSLTNLPDTGWDVVAEDQKAKNTAGGSAVVGANRRVLNTLLRNTLGATLSGNVVSGLPAGTYRIEWEAPAAAVDNHQTVLVNATSSTELGRGGSERNTTATSYVSNRSRGSAIVTLAAGASLAIDHYCQSAAATTGLGYAANFGVEVYGRISIKRLSS